MAKLEPNTNFKMKRINSLTRNLACSIAGFLVACMLVCLPTYGFTLETRGMKGPKYVPAVAQPNREKQSSVVSLKSFLLGGVRFFQKQISPIDGPRCSFSPTCSQFGYEAVHDHGSALGVVMTADRLMRCSYWTEDGPDYTRLPNGALYDPVANNLLKKP